MIDTVALRHIVPMHSPAKLEKLGFTSKPKGKLPRWIYNPPKGSHLPRLTWTAYSEGNHWLNVEASLPKLLVKNNIHILNQDEIFEALIAFQRETESLARVDFDAYSALAGRVDYCTAWHVGPTLLRGYLQALHKLELPFMESDIRPTTVSFLSSTRRLQFYGKEAEVEAQRKKGLATKLDVASARGVLRMEVGFRKGVACRRLAEKLSLPDRTARTMLDVEIARAVLTTELERVNLHQPIESESARIEALREAFGPENVGRYLAFLTMRDSLGEKEMVKQRFYSRSTFYEYKRHLKAKGLLTSTAAPKQLPPLTVIQGGKARLAKVA